MHHSFIHWYMWFNLNLMNLWEYFFLCTKTTKIITLFNNVFSSVLVFDARAQQSHDACVCILLLLGCQIGWKTTFEFFTKILSKFELYSNLKGINSVRKKRFWLLSWGHIEQNITKCTFFQSRAGQHEQKLISLYFCPDLRYTYLGILCLD